MSVGDRFALRKSSQSGDLAVLDADQPAIPADDNRMPGCQCFLLRFPETFDRHPRDLQFIRVIVVHVRLLFHHRIRFAQ